MAYQNILNEKVAIINSKNLYNINKKKSDKTNANDLIVAKLMGVFSPQHGQLFSD